MKIFKIVIKEILDIFWFLIRYFPAGTGVLLRRIVIKYLVKKCGTNFYCEEGINITGFKNIEISNNLRFMRYSSLNAHNKGFLKIGNKISVNFNVNINASDNGHIEIGDNVSIGQNTVIRASDHNYKNSNIIINELPHAGGKILIGNNVWIGANCIILKNVTIEDNCVIGAGSIITKNIKENEVVVGLNKRLSKKSSI